MRHFTALYFGCKDANDEVMQRLWATEFSNERVQSLWCGEWKPKGLLSQKLLREWAMECAGIGEWLMEACRLYVGTVNETIALLPGEGEQEDVSMAVILAEIEKLEGMSLMDQKQWVMAIWGKLGSDERWLLNQLLMGRFKSPVANLNNRSGSNDLTVVGGSIEIKAVLLYAKASQLGSSFSELSLALRGENNELQVIARVGMGDLERNDQQRLQLWIKENTTERFGPVRSVKAQQIFTLYCEGVVVSKRHKVGMKLISPRLLSWDETAAVEGIGYLKEISARLK